MTRRTYAALAGVTSAAVALGVAELVAVLTGPRSAPLVAVGGVVVDAVPGPVKEFGIRLFGVHDKTALLIGTAVLLAAFAAGVGVLAARSSWYAAAGTVLFAAVGVAAAVTRHDAGVGAALPSLVGAAAAAGTLWLLINGPLAPAAGGLPAPPDPVVVARVPASPAVGAQDARAERRRFLRTVTITLGVAAVAGAGGRLLATRRDVAAARAALALPTPVSPAPPVPAGARVARPGQTPYLTANRDFYRIDTALAVPQVDPDSWRLRVHGRVRRPMMISFADLLRRPMVERYVTLACVSNEVGGHLIGNARWLGVPIADLLDEVEPLAGADQVVGRSADGWTCGTPTAVLRDGRDALLAVGMNGAPLPVAHGFPVRMVVPGLYGYVSACKWVVELELTSFADFDAYWVPRGWSARAPVKTQSRIDTPRGRVGAGQVVIAGVAWAQHRGISRVEVRVDSGPWQRATLAGTVSVDTWRQWYLPWSATPGEHTLQVRATDGTGVTQPEQRRPAAPDGATGWHTVPVRVSGG